MGKERKELGTRTIFNLIGPLANPAPIKGQLMGIFDGDLVNKIGEVLVKLGIERGLVVHGEDGLDEITTTSSTKVCEICNGKTKVYKISPEDWYRKGIYRGDKWWYTRGKCRNNTFNIKRAKGT